MTNTSDHWPDIIPELITELCGEIQRQGGSGWLVGGCVRDLSLDIAPKDFDLEVFGCDESTLRRICQKFGQCLEVGKQFGIVKLQTVSHTIDLALPRQEVKTDHGHRGFSVQTDPHLPPEKAASRRDFTINALMWNPISGELLDFFDGLQDLQSRTLRHVSPAFAEDPLRPLRAMQFAARFSLTLAPDTAQLCQSLLTEAHTLPGSRIWVEWQKWAHAAHPTFGLQCLHDSGWLALYPELQAMQGCPQEPRWHPEGDVWNHTALVCNQAARIATRESLNDQTREHLLFGALCHDLGKPLTTFTDENDCIRSPNHSVAGIEPTRAFLKRIHAPARIIDHVVPLVHDHICHLFGQPTDRAIRRLSHRLEPATIELWEMLVEADASGRAPAPPSRPAQTWVERAQQMNIHQSRPIPIVSGKMLIQYGVKPGPEMGQQLEKAYHEQLNGEFDTTEEAVIWLKKMGIID